MSFVLPRQTTTQSGHTRRVGVEFEYAGLELDRAAHTIVELFGGTTRQVNKFHVQVENTRLGDFSVEVDASLLKDQLYLEFLRKIGIDLPKSWLHKPLEEVLLKLASTVIPHEVVTPPIPMTELYRAEELKVALMRQKAMGTKQSLIYAFGLHLNPELPSLEVHVIRDYLRAFFLLEPWLKKNTRTDISRKFTPFINDFPWEYTQKVLDPDYNPDVEKFIRDYLEYNPTRNRSLDVLPLLAFLHNDMVFESVHSLGPIKPRPALHYRLPNSLIDDPEWTLAQEWNLWVEVENLANDQNRMEKLSRLYLHKEKVTLLSFAHEWAEEVEQWLF